MGEGLVAAVEEVGLAEEFGEGGRGVTGEAVEPEGEEFAAGVGGGEREEDVADEGVEPGALPDAGKNFAGDTVAEGGEFMAAAEGSGAFEGGGTGGESVGEFGESVGPVGPGGDGAGVLLKAAARVIGRAETGEFPARAFLLEEVGGRGRMSDPGGEGVFERKGGHGRAVAAVAEGFERELVAGLGPAVAREALGGEGVFLAPAVEGAIEQAGAAGGGRTAEEVFERAEGVAAFGGEEGFIGGVVLEVALKAVEEDELLGGIAGGSARGGFGGSGWEKDDVEGDAGVARVAVVAVGGPIAGVEVDLDIAADAAAREFEFGAVEVGAFVEVPVAGMAEADGLAGDGAEIGGAEIAAEPDFLEDAFGDSVGAVEALHFGEGGSGRVGDGGQCVHGGEQGHTAEIYLGLGL